MIIALIEDLMFSSKIKVAAQEQNLSVKIIRRDEQFIEVLKNIENTNLIIDLNCKKNSAIECIKKYKATPGAGKVIAFFSHVEVELASQAEDAGADIILPRSKFVQEIPEILSNYAISA